MTNHANCSFIYGKLQHLALYDTISQGLNKNIVQARSRRVPFLRYVIKEQRVRYYAWGSKPISV